MHISECAHSNSNASEKVSEFWQHLNQLGAEYHNLHACAQRLRFPGGAFSPIPLTPRAKSPIVTPTLETPKTCRLTTVAHVTPVRAVQPERQEIPMLNRDGSGDELPCETELNVGIENLFASTPLRTIDSDSAALPPVSFDMRRDVHSSTSTVCLFTNVSTPGQTTAVESMAGRDQEPRRSNGFVLWPVWQTRVLSESYSTVSFYSGLGTHRTSYNKKKIHIGDTVRAKASCLQRFVVPPTSILCIVWDLVSLCIMCYDMVLFPLSVFKLPHCTCVDIMSYFNAIFWTCDMILSLFVGFHKDGVIEMRPSKIATRYFKTWFMIDLVVVIADWLSLVKANLPADPSILRITKSVRLVRVVRVIRFFRVVQMLSWIVEFATDESIMVLLGVLKFMAIILVINHYVACGWYAIGEHDISGSGFTWVDQFRENNPKSWLTHSFWYTTCLHWSFTQFTPASMEVHPENTMERIYAIVVLLTGLVGFSSFVSGITAAMTTLRQMNLEKTRQSEYVRRYITDRHISVELGNRVFSFLRNKGFVKDQRLMEEHVTAFKRLPNQLLMDLHNEIFAPLLWPHPIFHHMHLVDSEAFSQICHEVARESSCVENHIFFSVGQEATKLVLMTRGSGVYFRGTGRSCAQDVSLGTAISEAVLWLCWRHQGTLEATSAYCEFVAVTALGFHNVVRNSASMLSCQKYARQFVERLEVNSDMMSDVWFDFDAVQEMAQRGFEEQMDTINRTNSARFNRSLLKSMLKTKSSDLSQFLRKAVKTTSADVGVFKKVQSRVSRFFDTRSNT